MHEGNNMGITLQRHLIHSRMYRFSQGGSLLAFGSRRVLPEDRRTHNLYSLRLELVQGNLGPPNCFLLQKSFNTVPSASSGLLSPRPMRLIRLVITPLHPRDQLQYLFNRIPAQR
jgi:hypothetical protein